MGELGITEIEVDHYLGLGPIPDFRFTARSNGTYSYEGRRHVEPLGERVGRFPDYLFARLAELCFELNIMALADTYPSSVDDLSIMILTVRHASGVKVIRNEAANGCPPRLWGFAILVEHAMREAFQIEDRRRS